MVVDERSPSTKATLGSNCAHLTARYDPRTGWILAIAAIDNLTKGAAGQAIQCANLALGLPETAGLPITGVPVTDGRNVRRRPTKAAILVEALPYIRRFWGQVVVVKYGGNALAGAPRPARARRRPDLPSPRAGLLRHRHRAHALGRACGPSWSTVAAPRSAS